MSQLLEIFCGGCSEFEKRATSFGGPPEFVTDAELQTISALYNEGGVVTRA